VNRTGSAMLQIENFVKDRIFSLKCTEKGAVRESIAMSPGEL